MLDARHGWDAEAVTAPALAALANGLIWTGQFDLAEHWLDRARRATQADGEPGIRLLVYLTSAILQAARGHYGRALEEFAAARQMQALMVGEHGLTTRVRAWTIATQAEGEPGIRLLVHLSSAILRAARGHGHQALEEFAAAGRMQALMVGEHGLTTRVNAWAIATQARLGSAGQARAALAALDGRQAGAGETRNAAAVILLAEHDPAAARRELRVVLGGDAPVLSYLTRVEAYLLDAFACRDLGDERGCREAVEQALNLAEPDRLILPFAMTDASQLLKTVQRHGTSHAALVTDILDTIRGPGQDGPNQPAVLPAEELSKSELRVLRYLPTNLTRREIAGRKDRKSVV
jgi:LuxR family maltose regulon positive regulatory protein